MAMSRKQTLKTISLLWMGALLGAGFTFLVQVILARYLTPLDFGNFAAALATTALFVPLAGFGAPQYLLKVFGHEGWNATRWFPSTFHFVILSTILTFVLLVLWALLGPHDEHMQIMLLILSFYVLGQVTVELVGSKLQLEEQYQYLALWQLFPHLIRLILIASFIFLLNQSINGILVSFIYAGVALSFTIIGVLQLSRMIKGHFDLKGHLQNTTTVLHTIPDIKMVISQAWPFGLAGLFHLIYFQSDIILVKYISGGEAAGNYNVAFTIMVAIYILPSVLYQKFLLPKMHRWAHHDRKKFYETYRQGNLIMLVVGIVAMIIVWISSSWAIPFLFGAKYTDSAQLLNILALSIPVIFVASSVGATLVTKEHMKNKVKYMGGVAVLNIVLNIVLIPLYGAIGAAISTVISNIFLLVVFYLAVEKYVFVDKNTGLD